MPGELIPIIMFISAAAVLIFRPLTTRIGKVIERSHSEGKSASDPQLQRVMQLMERLVDRIPIARSMYSILKQFMQAVFGSSTASNSSCVRWARMVLP